MRTNECNKISLTNKKICIASREYKPAKGTKLIITQKTEKNPQKNVTVPESKRGKKCQKKQQMKNRSTKTLHQPAKEKQKKRSILTETINKKKGENNPANRKHTQTVEEST